MAGVTNVSPERRARIVAALVAIFDEVTEPRLLGAAWLRFDLERLSDTDLTVKIANIEALVERAQQTDV